MYGEPPQIPAYVESVDLIRDLPVVVLQPKGSRGCDTGGMCGFRRRWGTVYRGRCQGGACQCASRDLIRYQQNVIVFEVPGHNYAYQE